MSRWIELILKVRETIRQARATGQAPLAIHGIRLGGEWWDIEGTVKRRTRAPLLAGALAGEGTGGMSGWKTYTAAALAALLALNRIFHWLSPEVESTLLGLAAALGLVGIGHKLDKVRASSSAAAEVVAEGALSHRTQTRAEER